MDVTGVSVRAPPVSKCKTTCLFHHSSGTVFLAVPLKKYTKLMEPSGDFSEALLHISSELKVLGFEKGKRGDKFLELLKS